MTSPVRASMESSADSDLSSPDESENNNSGEASTAAPVDPGPITRPGSQSESDFDPGDLPSVNEKRGADYTKEDFARLFDATEAAFEAMVSAGDGGPDTTGPTAEDFEKLTQEKDKALDDVADLRDRLVLAEDDIQSKYDEIIKLREQLDEALKQDGTVRAADAVATPNAAASTAVPCRKCSAYAHQILILKFNQTQFADLQRDLAQLRNQLAEKNRLCAAAERDVQIYQQRLDELGTERGGLKLRVHSLRKLAKKRKRRLVKSEEQKQHSEEKAREKLADVQAQNEKLAASLQDTNVGIGNMNNVVAQHKQRADQLDRELKDQKEADEALRAKVAALEQELAELKENMENDAAENALAKQALENSQNDILERDLEITRWKNVAEKVQEGQRAADEKDREIQHWKKTANDQRQYYEQKLKTASDQVSESRALLENYASTRTLNEQLRHENGRLRHDLKQANERAFGAAATAAGEKSPAASFDQTELERLRKENSRLTDDLQKRQIQATVDQKMNQRHYDELTRKHKKELTDSAAQLETEKLKLSNDNLQLKMDLEQAKLDCSKLRGEIAKLQNAVSGVEILKKEKANLQTKYNDLKKAYDECSQKSAQRQADLTRVTGELESTKTEKQLLISENSKLQRQASELSDQVASLMLEKENLPAKIKAEILPFQEANKTLLKRATKAEEDLKREQNLTAVLQTSISAAEADLERVQAELTSSDLQQKLSGLHVKAARRKEQLAELEKRVQDLRRENEELRRGRTESNSQPCGAEKSALEQRIQELESLLQNADLQALQELQAQHDVQQAQLQAHIDSLSRDLEAEKLNKQTQQTTYFGDVAQFLRDLATARGERAQLKIAYDALVEGSKRIETERLQQISQLQTDVDVAQAKISDLDRSHAELQHTEGTLLKLSGQLKLRNRSLRKELEEAKMEHLQQQHLHSGTVKALENRLNKFQNTIRILTSST